jgi:cell division protein FtsB
MGSSKYLIIGLLVGMAIGAFVFYAFMQFSQISNLQTQINQLQSENSQLKANNTALLNQISGIQPSPTT